MEKKQRKYTITEVAKDLKVSVGKLRDWEDTFSYTLNVQRTKTGARLYTDIDTKTLKKIKILKEKNMNEEQIHFILDAHKHNQHDEPSEEPQEFVEMLLSLQNETTETLQNLTDSFTKFKEELTQDIKQELRSEMNAGHHKTKTLIQSYSHMVVDSAENTQEELVRLRQDIHREEEEKLFIQQKLEEREEQFKEFVMTYRESAAAKERNRLSDWIAILKTKRDESIDFFLKKSV